MFFEFGIKDFIDILLVAFLLYYTCLLYTSTLQQLANYHRRQMRTPIIGITGTNGKTTTKELMSTVLSQGIEHVVSLRKYGGHQFLGSSLSVCTRNADDGCTHLPTVVKMCIRDRDWVV